MFSLFVVVLASFWALQTHLHVITSYSSIVFLVSMCPLSLLPCTVPAYTRSEFLLTKHSTVNSIPPHWQTVRFTPNPYPWLARTYTLPPHWYIHYRCVLQDCHLKSGSFPWNNVYFWSPVLFNGTWKWTHVLFPGGIQIRGSCVRAFHPSRPYCHWLA